MGQTASHSADIAGSSFLRDALVLLLPPLILFCYVLISPQVLADGDTGWHIAAGEWMLRHLRVPTQDIFSYTAADQPWTAHEWLADVLMGFSYSAAGWWGILLFYALALAGLGGILAAHARHWLEPLAAMILVGWMVAGTMPFILARPHVLAWLPLALWTVALLRARDADGTPPLHAVWVMVLWANLHGSFIFGLVLIGPFAAEALFAAAPERRVAVLTRWAVFGSAALLACLVTPFGLSGLLFPLQLMAMPALGSVAEWLPSDFSSIGLFQILLLSGLAACLWLGLRLPAWRLAIVIGLLHMALSHVRHQAIFTIVTGLIVAGPLAAALRDGGPRFAWRAAWREHRRDGVTLFAIVALLGCGFALFSITRAETRFDSANVPLSAVARITPDMQRFRGFNDYSFGGALALAGIPVFIDGRVDMYGGDLLREYQSVFGARDAATWDAAQHRWQFGWTILPPDAPLVALLDSDPGWHRVHADRWAVVHAAKDIGTIPRTDR